MEVYYQVKYTCTYEPVIPFWAIYLRNMNTYVCLQQELCRNVYTSFTHNSPPPPKSLLQFKANPKIPLGMFCIPSLFQYLNKLITWAADCPTPLLCLPYWIIAVSIYIFSSIFRSLRQRNENSPSLSHTPPLVPAPPLYVAPSQQNCFTVWVPSLLPLFRQVPFLSPLQAGFLPHPPW